MAALCVLTSFAHRSKMHEFTIRINILIKNYLNTAESDKYRFHACSSNLSSSLELFLFGCRCRFVGLLIMLFLEDFAFALLATDISLKMNLNMVGEVCNREISKSSI